jgi:hypothetical protein
LQAKVAKLEEIVETYLQGALTHGDPVQGHGLGADKIVNDPPFRRQSNLGMAVADQSILENDFQSIQPANAETSIGFPLQALQTGAHAAHHDS